MINYLFILCKNTVVVFNFFTLSYLIIIIIVVLVVIQFSILLSKLTCFSYYFLDKNQTPNPTLSCVDKLCKDECDSIFFNEIYYLGCASLNAPRSLTETLKVISILRSSHKDVNNDSSHNSPSNNQECHQQIKIILSVPCKADGIVR